MRFDDALRYLADHDNLERAEGGPRAGVIHGLSLDRMRGIVDVLGNPQLAAPTIHITGTNGKGSVARMVSSILGAHGLTVGTYVSPHLERVTERIRRNADEITTEEFADVVSELQALEPLFPDRPSWFDLVTAAAFTWFAREAVEVQVIEVGMLGRFDSTNVVDADVAVITTIGFDHTDGAGDWRRAIAEEKAGIIGPDTAVVSGVDDAGLVAILRAEGGRQYWIRGEHFGVRSAVVAHGGRVVDLRTPGSVLDELFVPAHGVHQADNAALAVATVEAFFGRALDRDVVAEGLAAVELPGRFEVRSRSPLVVVDSAHNPDGTATTAATLTQEFRIPGALHLVVGFLGGRSLDDVLAPLVALGPATVTCVAPDSPRAVPADVVAAAVTAAAEAAGRSIDVTTADDLATSLRRRVDAMADTDALVVVGSTYLAGAARQVLRALGVGA